MLSRAGFDSPTGGAQEAARLLSDHGWAASTWRNRSSQLKRWLAFCDEDGRDPIPATEGDVMAYVGFLSLEGRIASVSLPHYLSAISRFHESQFLPSPTKTPMIRGLVAACARRHDSSRAVPLIRVGCGAGLVRQVVDRGMECATVSDVGHCAAMVFSFVFQCRSDTLAMVQPDDLVLSDQGVTAWLRKRKGKSLRRTLLVHYPVQPAWSLSNPVALLVKWATFRSRSAGFFDVASEESAGFTDLSTSLRRSLVLIGASAPAGCYYGSHSCRIGGFNELFLLGFSREWILRRLDWGSELMFRVYMDSSIVVSAHSSWFFAHLRPTS